MSPPFELRATRAHPLGMPPARFLRDYWQKRPLLVRGAFADFGNPVAPDDLAGLACEELALSRIVIERKTDPGLRGNDGGRRDEAACEWTLRAGPFEEGDFAKLPKTHWTLLVQDVDKWDADVAALLEPFAFLPDWRIDDVMVSYAENGGSVGAHVDQYDVFLLQGLGRRRWRIDAGTPVGKSARGHASREEPAYRDDTELKLLREFTPTHEWVLAPGDMLYLPPGVPHHGVAIGRCMTYSIGMRAPSQAELLVDFADHLAATLPEDARYADADLEPARDAGEIDAAAISRAMRAMPWIGAGERGPEHEHAKKRGRRRSSGPAAIDPSMLRAWFGCFITRYRCAQVAAPPPRALTGAAFQRALANGATLRRNPWSRVAWTREMPGALLFVSGEAHACSLALARTIGARREFPLATVTGARDRALVRALVDAGHLVLERAQRVRSDR